MATLQQSMQSMRGVGEAQKFKLASFLERNQIRGAVHMDKILYGEEGFVTRAKALDDNLDDHGREMITKITDLFKDSIGKSSTETRDILTKMKVIQKTLKGATDEQSSIIQELTKAGVAALQSQGSLFNVAKDVIGGRLRGFAGKQLMKIPGSGITSSIFSERKRRKGIAADAAAEFSGGDTGEENVDKLDEIDKNTEPEKEDKLGKRESMLESLRGKVGGFMGKVSGRNREDGGGGLGGLLGSLLPAGLAGGLGGMLAAAGGGLVGFLTAGLSALAGLASFIAPVVIPLLAVAAVGAAAYTLGSMIYKKLGIDEAIDEGSEKGTAGMAKGITKNEEISTSDGSRIFRDEQGQMTTERFSSDAKAAMQAKGISEDSDEASLFEREQVERIAMTKGGLALDYDQNSESFKKMMSGDLTGEQFLQAEKEAKRKKGEGPSRNFLTLYQDVLNADESMRNEWSDFNRRYESGELSTFGFTKGDWAAFVSALVTTNKGVRDGILMTERNGLISPKEAEALFSMSPFIGRWEPQHNDTLTGMTVDDEYNMPGFFNDLNLGDDLKNYKTYPKASRSLAAQYAMGKIPQLAKGGLIAELHSGEAVIPLSKAMMSSAGTLSEGAKLLIQTLMGNALFKGTEPAGGGAGGTSNVIAPISNSVVSQTDNIFAGTPFTRNTEPSIRDMQRLLYA